MRDCQRPRDLLPLLQEQIGVADDHCNPRLLEIVAGRAADVCGWPPKTPTEAILDELAAHAGENPHWLQPSAPD